VTVFSVELVLYAIGTVFVIFMLVADRAVAVHKTAASMDPLTGLFNRRGFAEACSRVIEREANAGRPVTVMIFDIDHFKGSTTVRPSRGRRDPETILGRGGQQSAPQRSFRADWWRGIRGDAAVSAG